MSGGEKKIFLVRVCQLFDFKAFGEFIGLSLCCSSTGYVPCALNERNPIPILSVRLSMILSSG